jgi:hypothetical protein
MRQVGLGRGRSTGGEGAARLGAWACMAMPMTTMLLMMALRLLPACARAGERTVWLPEGLQGGDLLELCDTWVDRSHPAALMASAAFTQVCVGCGDGGQHELGARG